MRIVGKPKHFDFVVKPIGQHFRMKRVVGAEDQYVVCAQSFDQLFRGIHVKGIAIAIEIIDMLGFLRSPLITGATHTITQEGPEGLPESTDGRKRYAMDFKTPERPGRLKL
jgi:hypothetical protein